MWRKVSTFALVEGMQTGADTEASSMEIPHKRNKGLLPFVTACMELESIMLSEISQAVKDKYHMISPLTGT